MTQTTQDQTTPPEDGVVGLIGSPGALEAAAAARSLLADADDGWVSLGALTDEELRNAFLAQIEREGFVDLYDRANGDDFYAALPAALPVLILAGDQDPVTAHGEGAYHVGNALAVIAAAQAAGMTLEQIVPALAAARPASRWRMEVTRRDDGGAEFEAAAHTGLADHLHALPRVSVNGHHQTEAALSALLSGVPFLAWNRGRRLNVA